MMTIARYDTNCNVSITVEGTISMEVTVCQEVLCLYRGEGAPTDSGQEDAGGMLTCWESMRPQDASKDE